MKKLNLGKIEHWKLIALFLAVYDMVTANMSYFLALLARYDFQFSKIENRYLDAWVRFIPVYAIVVILIYWACKLYHSMWRFAGAHELVRTVFATTVSCVLHTILITLLCFSFQSRMPISYYVGGYLVQLCFTLSIRFFYRVYNLLLNRGSDPAADPSRVMIVGAGEAGRMIYHDIENNNRSNMKVVCFIDDNPNKWNRFLEGIPVAGGREEILAAAEKYRVDKIFVAITNADASDKREINGICAQAGVEVRVLPSVSQLVNGEVSVSQMKSVAVEDLLGRDVIKVNNEDIFKRLTGKTVLVTGGGGSIGSELCRQVANHRPEQLIIFDIYENNAYDIQQELRKKHPELNLVVLIGSVRDSRRIESVFEKYRPQVVFHAAAHKHVPLMEDSPCEAVKNNVIGTYKTAYAAVKYGCDRFVLISTDKAVNPTNVMGGSKRICEMVIQTFDEYIKKNMWEELPVLFTHASDGETTVDDIKPHTEFVAVRFGNVLGSNGSVIPLFKKQIENGGPVTVTHPDIIRYFMTIPEAVSLVLQASVYAHGGEIFVLDMGEPVKIDTLARNLIRLSGYRPDVDIKIVYTGLRPGEKLYEEKLMNEEGLAKTDNELIFIGKPVEFDRTEFLGDLRELQRAAYENDEDTVRKNVMAVVRKGGAKKVKNH